MSSIPQGLLVLQNEYGISELDWRRIASDPLVAARVAAAIQGVAFKPPPAPVDFDALITGELFEQVSSYFGKSHRDEWYEPLGETVRGGFHVLQMPGVYYHDDAIDYVRQANERGRHQMMATACELALYAVRHWSAGDFEDNASLMALGSWFRDQRGEVYCPVLRRGLSGRPVLDVEPYGKFRTYEQVLLICD